MEIIKLTNEQHQTVCTEEYYEDEHGVGHQFTRIKKQHAGSGRHQEYWEIVLQRNSDKKYFGAGYSDSVKDSMGWRECNEYGDHELTELKLSGLELIEEERARHIKLGFDALHDSTEVEQELAIAAGLYALDGTYAQQMLENVAGPSGLPDDLWPWNDGSYPDKRGQLDRVRQLTIAGALIAAEIDRLQAL